MALDYPPGGGVNSVPEYQISSVPYSATGLISAIRTGTFDQVKTAGGDETISFIRFPRVTRWIYIKVTNGTALPIYFNEIDAADEAAIHAYTVAGNTETLVLPWRVQKLYFHSSDVVPGVYSCWFNYCSGRFAFWIYRSFYCKSYLTWFITEKNKNGFKLPSE